MTITVRKLSAEEAESIAARCGAACPADFPVKVVPTGVPGEDSYVSRRELVQKARRVFWRNQKFKAAERKREKLK
jgi:hypothetical protein